ncbi:AAA family ATPase [bacterium]|nr:AAA family ATPase [bacterium]
MIELSGYAIRDVIHEGSRSVVFRGSRIENDLPVVIKLLKEEYPTNRELARFAQEYEITHNLDLQNVIQVYNLERHKNGLAIVMEDIAGEALNTILPRLKPDLAELVSLAGRISEILVGVHRKDIIHNDINPSNIIWNPESGQIRLIDFGISTRLIQERKEIKNPGGIEGTLAYISPEQTGRMNRAVDYRSDLYSLGVTLYEMFTGNLPFQTRDLMELLHAHISLPPTPPFHIVPAIPEVLSDIVLKALAKDAENRYQGALGLKMDLDKCFEQLQVSGRVDYFEIGQKDIPERFLIPEKLYGREREREILYDEFARAKRGAARMLLVEGAPGIGKSSLISEIHKPLIEGGGTFIASKFDQSRKSSPFSGFTQAFRQLIRQLLSEPQESLDKWKSKIIEAIAPNGKLITDMVPELELIIGCRPEVEALNPMDALNRFHITFYKFVQVFTRYENPLVIFIDDLQWADLATLDLLKVLMTNPSAGNLLVIGAYRDNEVDRSHPLTLTLDKIYAERKHEAAIIKLNPLGDSDFVQFLSETLHCQPDKAETLATIVSHKTSRNPFFVKQFLQNLYEEKTLFFNPDKYSWDWDIEALNRATITNNVVDLLVNRLRNLPSSTQVLMKLASCIGTRFDLKTLSSISKQTQEKTSEALFPALKEGLILSFNDRYSYLPIFSQEQEEENISFSFLHDRVHQAAYSLISQEVKTVVHLEIGRMLLAEIKEVEQEEFIFRIVNHLNQGIEKIVDPQETYALVNLNLKAGRKAKSTTAWKEALSYFEIGISLLDDLSWQHHYDLTHELFKERAEAEFLNGNYEKAEALIQVLLTRVKNNLEKIKVYELLINLHTVRAKFSEAMEAGKIALKLVGLVLPEDDQDNALLDEIELASKNLGGRKIAELINEPEMTDPEKQAAMNLLMNLNSTAYLSDQKLYAVIILKMVNLSLQHGNVPESSKAYSTYGNILGSVNGDYAAGYEFGVLGMRMSEKYNALKCRSFGAVLFFINHWSRHIRESDFIGREAYQAGLDSGDIQYTGWVSVTWLLALFYQGQALPGVMSKISEFLNFSQKANNLAVIDALQGIRLCLESLTSLTVEPSSFIANDYSEKEFHKDCESHRSLLAMGIFLVLKAQVLYLHGNYALSHTVLLETEKYLGYIRGISAVAHHNFYSSLVHCALFLEVSDEQQQQFLDLIKTNQQQMKIWADNCPENYRHKYLLVEAEITRIEGKPIEAMKLYEQCVALADQQEFIQEAAIANELAGNLFFKEGLERPAAIYLKEAQYLYKKWGASAKAAQLNLTNPIYPAAGSKLDENITTGTTHYSDLSVTSSDTGIGSILDINTVIKTMRAISSEIDLEKLLKKMLKIMMENAGADKGVLVLRSQEDDLQIVAQADASRSEIDVLQNVPVTEIGVLPETIVRFVSRTGEDVILHRPAVDGNFTRDPYILEHKPKSILCTPLRYRDRIPGVLYLENNLIETAFTREGIRILQILLPQAAISLENAELFEKTRQSYDALKKSEKRFRTLFENVPEGITVTDHDGNFLAYNDAVPQITGYTKDELKEVNAFNFYRDGGERLFLLEELRRKGIVRSFDTVIIGKNRVDIAISLTMIPFTYDDQPVILTLLKDITERKKTQEIIIQSEKMMSVGGLAAGMAHEINNPLGVMMNLAQTISRRVSLDLKKNSDIAEEIGIDLEKINAYMEKREIFQYLTGIRQSGERAARIVRNMLDFSRKSESIRVEYNIHDLLEKSLELASKDYDLKKNFDFRFIRINREYENTLFPVRVIETEIEQVFLNLLKNAAQAIVEKRFKDETPTITLRTMQDTGWIRIEIEDNGFGMDEETRKRIFEPFFTTKEVGRGTGLGLSVSYFIITKNHDGEFYVESGLNTGTKFIIRLPLT